MNKDRRAKLSQALDLVSECRDEQEEAYDNLPENFRETESGMNMEAEVESMQDITDLLEELVHG